jgi:uncharacterized membrane protein
MRNDKVINMLEVNNLSEHFQIVSETCGIETAMVLITKLGGILVSIPQMTSLKTLIERYVQENAENISIKNMARVLNMNERVIASISKKFKNC